MLNYSGLRVLEKVDPRMVVGAIALEEGVKEASERHIFCNEVTIH